MLFWERSQQFRYSTFFNPIRYSTLFELKSSWSVIVQFHISGDNAINCKTTNLSDPLEEVDEMQAVYSFSIQRELKSTVTSINFLWYTGAGQDFTGIARWWVD